jgi:hypothetical protein
LTLKELREGTLEWLDDPHGDQFAPAADNARLDRYINEAYQKIVNEVDRIPRPLDVQYAADTLDITTSSADREYTIGVVRRVLAVFEVKGDEELEVNIVGWAERNTAGSGVYIFRPTSTTFPQAEQGSFVVGSYALGVASMPPAYATLRVYTLPNLVRLAGNGDVPVSVPDDFHELLYYRAAMLAKMSVNRDPGNLTALYAEGLADMRVKLATRMGDTMRAPRMSSHRRGR